MTVIASFFRTRRVKALESAVEELQSRLAVEKGLRMSLESQLPLEGTWHPDVPRVWSGRAAHRRSEGSVGSEVVWLL